MQRFFKVLTLIALAALSAACSQPTVTDEPGGEFAAEGLVRVKSSGFEQAYVRPDAQLATYEAVMIADIQVADVRVSQTAVAGTVRNDWLMNPEREQTLKDIWRKATARAFADYPRNDSGEPAMRLESELTDITPGRSSGSATTAGGQRVAGSADSVDISAEFRLYDQASGDLIAVIRDRQTLPSMMWTRTGGSDMSNQFSRWAGLLHTRISGH